MEVHWAMNRRHALKLGALAGVYSALWHVREARAFGADSKETVPYGVTRASGMSGPSMLSDVQTARSEVLQSALRRPLHDSPGFSEQLTA